ncbi:MAG TPA: MarR family winged helix-turn-helix transcriptional regulator [Acidimicrobiales bacterium]|nr:MarR family winged helix-turn-helix transcriptional regulator [Acidimicrobiales bacterium]
MVPPRPQLTEAQLAAWRAFVRAQALVLEVLARELEEERGMPLPFYDVLVHLSEAPEGRLRMRELAGAVLLSRSGLTRLVDRMEQAGYVTREACPSDRRGSYATITEAGLRALADAWPVHARGVLEHFAGPLDEPELAVLRDALGRIADTVASRGCGPCDEDEALTVAGGVPPSVAG